MGPGLATEMLGMGRAAYQPAWLCKKSVGRRPVVLGIADAEQRLLQNDKPCPEKGSWEACGAL